MKVVQDATASSVDRNVKETIYKKSVVFTGKNHAYANLEKLVETHVKVKPSANTANSELNWVHTAISNLKKNCQGSITWSLKSTS
ncbi:hypothetical protein J2X69_005120 [Algoriphagus sp. 4150]|nr:transposase [Algoriphagus sp. 4150]MDR7132746.1 hypothetical protein [Algoriphagus sp. 4150]